MQSFYGYKLFFFIENDTARWARDSSYIREWGGRNGLSLELLHSDMLGNVGVGEDSGCTQGANERKRFHVGSGRCKVMVVREKETEGKMWGSQTESIAERSTR